MVWTDMVALMRINLTNYFKKVIFALDLPVHENTNTNIMHFKSFNKKCLNFLSEKQVSTFYNFNNFTYFQTLASINILWNYRWMYYFHYFKCLKLIFQASIFCLFPKLHILLLFLIISFFSIQLENVIGRYEFPPGINNLFLQIKIGWVCLVVFYYLDIFDVDFLNIY